MALRYFDSFDRGLTSGTPSGKAWPSVQIPLAVTSPVHIGGQSITMNDTPHVCIMGDFARGRVVGSQGAGDFDEADLYLSFYLLRDASTTLDDRICKFGWQDTSILQPKTVLKWGSSNVIKLNDTEFGSGTDIEVGTTQLNADQWYRIDMYVGTGTSANYEVRIDGVIELSGTANFGTNNTDAIEFHTLTGYNHYIDDVVIDDAAFHSLGNEYFIVPLYPNGNGNYTSWTGAYTDVDDHPEYDTWGTVISTTSNGNAETVALDSLPGYVDAGDIVDAVLFGGAIRKDTNPDVACVMRDRLGSTDRDTSSFLLEKDPGSGNYRNVSWLEIYTTDPSSNAWTQSNVNSWEIGLVHAQAQSRTIECTILSANVLLTRPAVSSFEASIPSIYKPMRHPLLRM